LPIQDQEYAAKSWQLYQPAHWLHRRRCSQPKAGASRFGQAVMHHELSFFHSLKISDISQKEKPIGSFGTDLLYEQYVNFDHAGGITRAL
jgi:hypothetical protein